MSIPTPLPASMPVAGRAFFNLPILGWIARDVVYGSDDNIWYALVIALTVLVLSVKTWGVVALVMAALGFVPVMFLLMIVIASPWAKTGDDH